MLGRGHNALKSEMQGLADAVGEGEVEEHNGADARVGVVDEEGILTGEGAARQPTDAANKFKRMA